MTEAEAPTAAQGSSDTLVIEARAGDADAFEALVASRLPRTHRMAVADPGLEP